MPLSLILTFRNEEENLRKNLESVLSGDHTEFEVVAVDNCSQDESSSVLTGLKAKYPNLKVSSLKQEVVFSGKMAQNIALKAARHDWVSIIAPTVNLTGTNQVQEISSRLGNGSQTVVNYCNVKPEKSFYNLLYRTEMFHQQLKSFGFIKNGLSYVANQENTAFKKHLYFDVDGYRGKISEPFANLELVINSFIRKEPVSLVISAETACMREEKITSKDYVELIKKEAIVRKHLPFGTRLLLDIYRWAYLLMIPVVALLVIRMPEIWPYVTGLLTILVFCNLLIIKKLLARLQEFKLFLPSFLIALILPYIKLIFRIFYSRYGVLKEWKIGN